MLKGPSRFQDLQSTAQDRHLQTLSVSEHFANTRRDTYGMFPSPGPVHKSQGRRADGRTGWQPRFLWLTCSEDCCFSRIMCVWHHVKDLVHLNEADGGVREASVGVLLSFLFFASWLVRTPNRPILTFSSLSLSLLFCLRHSSHVLLHPVLLPPTHVNPHCAFHPCTRTFCSTSSHLFLLLQLHHTLATALATLLLLLPP